MRSKWSSVRGSRRSIWRRKKTSVRDRYGRTDFGQGCLLARRLVEQGVTFVEVEAPGWDTHADNFNRVKTLAGGVDPAFATLIADLKERGLLETTLVIWMGEFGRTPRINAKTGRDEITPSPAVVHRALAGGGIRGVTPCPPPRRDPPPAPPYPRLPSPSLRSIPAKKKTTTRRPPPPHAPAKPLNPVPPRLNPPPSLLPPSFPPSPPLPTPLSLPPPLPTVPQIAKQQRNQQTVSESKVQQA